MRHIDMDANVQPIPPIETGDDLIKEGRYQQALGTIKIVATFLNQLRANKIYDNTTVIILADHGSTVKPNPLLLMKLENSTGKMITSSAPVSMITDWEATINAIITGDYENKNAIFNLSPQIGRQRRFYEYDINEDRSYNLMVEWNVTASSGAEIANYESWFIPQKVYLDGEVYYFDEFCVGNEDYCWMKGNSFDVYVTANGSARNVLLHFKYSHVYHGQQIVEVYANNQLITNFTAYGDEEKDIIIPQEYFDGNDLHIKLVFPNASSPFENGESEDVRILSLAMTEMFLQYTDVE